MTASGGRLRGQLKTNDLLRNPFLQELLQSMTEEERETYRAEKRARSLELRAKEKESIQTTRKMIAESKQRVCIDMEWHSQLTEKELNSLYKQLNYTYAAVRKVLSSRNVSDLVQVIVDRSLTYIPPSPSFFVFLKGRCWRTKGPEAGFYRCGCRFKARHAAKGTTCTCQLRSSLLKVARKRDSALLMRMCS